METKNFRPISILLLISKVLEKVIHDQTQNFLTDNSILYCYQSGLRKCHSTDTCLSYLNDKILKGTDIRLMTGLILIDLQKAFDTIDHEILIKKTVHLQFSAQSILWFRSYLTNSTFLVNVEKSFSVPGKIECGVPQGSILGPLLFLLYVNDMPGAVGCEMLLYADDTCLVFQAKDIDTLSERLNTEFNKLCDWFIDNKLSIHFGEDKTKSILFTGKKRPKAETSISLEAGLRWWRKHGFLTLALRRLLCNALIQPHFDYASSAWYTNFQNKFSDKLQVC